MNLGVPQFPAAGSAQVAGGRNKVALKPGRSLMDWIRLSKSGKDLTGVRGQLRKVSPEELAKHNTAEDAWIALKGKVYNVSAYMDFHPGGEDELMRGVGQDATQLFDEVHRWVNYESMLASCLVGKLETAEVIPLRRAIERRRVSANELTPNGFAFPAAPPAKSVKSKPTDGPTTTSLKVMPTPRHEWFQTDKTVTLVVYTKWSNMTSDRVIIYNSSASLSVMLQIDDHTYRLHYGLEAAVSHTYEVTVSQPSGKTEIVMQKVNRGHQWATLGEELPGNSTFQKTSDLEVRYRSCSIRSIEEVTHDTRLYCISLPEGTRMPVPLGHHVHLKADIDGIEVVRSYTAVCPRLDASHQDEQMENGQVLYLMIKLYPAGAVTSYLSSLRPGDTLQVSNPEGSFLESRLKGVTDLFLCAAGTGLTPMVRLLHCTCGHSSFGPRVKMMFFNKTTRDILWGEQLKELETNCDRLEVVNILSDPQSGWTGLTGRIRQELVDAHLPCPQPDRKLLFCACGPTPFTKEAIRLAEVAGYTESETHAFLG